MNGRENGCERIAEQQQRAAASGVRRGARDFIRNPGSKGIDTGSQIARISGWLRIRAILIGGDNTGDTARTAREQRSANVAQISRDFPPSRRSR